MFYVYILRSKKDGKLYVGCTSNLENRIGRHEKGFVISTRSRLPIELIYKETFEDKSSAFQRERFLKSLWGAREKRKILKKFLFDQSLASWVELAKSSEE